MSSRKYKLQLSPSEFVILEEKMEGLVRIGWDHFLQCDVYAPEGTPLPEDKFDPKMNHVRKTQFESRLAQAILKNSKLFLPLLHKIGQIAATTLETALEGAPELKNEVTELYSSYLYSDRCFGRKGERDLLPRSNKAVIYFEALQILKWGQSIENILIIHMATFRIFTQLFNLADFPDFEAINGLFSPASLFANRGRSDLKIATPMVRSLGIEHKPTTPADSCEHTRAGDHYIRDHVNVSEFAFECFKKEIPFIAGPSGSAAECFKFMALMGRGLFTKDDYQSYAMACVGYLVGAGAHSFHEVYSVAALSGLPYVPGCYEHTIPEYLYRTRAYKKLIAEFPDVICAAFSRRLSPELKVDCSEDQKASESLSSPTIPPVPPNTPEESSIPGSAHRHFTFESELTLFRESKRDKDEYQLPDSSPPLPHSPASPSMPDSVPKDSDVSAKSSKKSVK